MLEGKTAKALSTAPGMHRALGLAEYVPRLRHLPKERHPQVSPSLGSQTNTTQETQGSPEVSSGISKPRLWGLGAPAGITACRALWGRNGRNQRMWKKRKSRWTSCRSLEMVGMAWQKEPVWKEASPRRALPKPCSQLSPGDLGQAGCSPRSGSRGAWTTTSRRPSAHWKQQTPTQPDSALFPKMRDAYAKPDSPSWCLGEKSHYNF